MKKFEVEIRDFVFIEAETLRDANQKMQEKYSEFETVDFYDLEEGISHEVIGHCEISGLSIFEEDKFLYDSEGIMWLKEFDEE